MKKNYLCHKRLTKIYNFNKIIIFVFAFLLINVTAKSQNKTGLNISVNLDNVSIKDAFNKIKVESGYNFMYKNSDINSDIRVTLKFQETDLKVVLDKLMINTNLKYKITNKQILISLKGKLNNIKGEVVDIFGDPLTGVNVIVKGTTIGSITDIDGKFFLEANDNAQLVVSFIGFTTKKINVNGRLNILIELKEDAFGIDEVVVVGYGTQKKSNLTGSVKSIKGEALSDVSSQDVSNMLQAKIAGVQVLNTSGRPGSVSTIRIRGKGSIGSSLDPLWVVDGVVSGSGAHLNPNEIASLTILKDASATALYGSRGSNGVIVVTTKTAKDGESKFSFSSKVGLATLATGNFEVMNGSELYDYQKTFNSEAYFKEDLKNRNTDWFDLATQTGISQSYNINYSGGVSNIRTFISGNYYKETGAVRGYEIERYSGRLNLDYQPNDDFILSAKINGSYFKDDDRQRSLGAAYLYMPWDSPTDANGKLVQGNGSDWIGRDGNNYLYDLQWNYEQSKKFGTDASLNFVWDIFDYLTFQSTNNFGIKFLLTKGYVDPRSKGGKADNGTVKDYLLHDLTRFTNQMIKFNKIFKKIHLVKFWLGYEFSDSFSENHTAVGKGIIEGKNVQGVTAEGKSMDGSYSEWAMQSYLFNANYSLDSKYMAQFSFRRDGSSKFGPDNRFGNFYTVSAGWNIKKESFLKNVKFINSLKFRTSYGVVGNVPNSSYAHLELFKVDANYNGKPAIIPFQLANPGLTWEKTKSTNLAFDIRLFERISINLDYYIKNTSDLLYYRKLSAITGFDGKWENIGAIKNSGVEFAADIQILKHTDVKFDFAFNIGINKNEIIEMADGKPQIKGKKRLTEGDDMDTWFLRKWVGVNSDNGKPQWEIVNKDGSVELTSDYNKATRQMLTSNSPDFMGGFTASLSYSLFNLSVNCAFSQGGQLYHGARELFDNDGAYKTFNSMKLKDGWSRWTKKGDNATHPKTIDGGNSMSNKTSSRYLEDASFFKIRNISFSMNIPKNYLEKLNLSSAKFFVNFDNVLTITDFSGIDPEVYNSSGVVNSASYPLTKKVILGFSFTF